MISSYRRFETADIPGVTRLVDDMRELLEALDEGIVPNRDDYGPEKLEAYLVSLVAGQRGASDVGEAGSWAPAPDMEDVDPDVRVELVYRPTYLAAATLSRALCDYPLTALAIPGYREALRDGLLCCSRRRLRGHGYEADAAVIDALRILSLGKVPWLLHRHPEFCPELKSVLDDVASDMAHRLASCSADGLWGEDYCEGFRCAIETMHLASDPEFMRSLEEARRDGVTVSKEDLPW